MISNWNGRQAKPTQSWQIGDVVNVGFVRGLMVIKARATPGDDRPDEYLLVSRDGRQYSFTPHFGLSRIG